MTTMSFFTVAARAWSPGTIVPLTEGDELFVC